MKKDVSSEIHKHLGDDTWAFCGDRQIQVTGSSSGSLDSRIFMAQRVASNNQAIAPVKPTKIT